MPISDYIRNLRSKVGNELLVMPSVGAVVINDDGHVLLHRRTDNGLWSTPGGALEPGEEPADAIIREVWEETGVQVVPERIVGVFSGPDYMVKYPNGDKVCIVSVVFACRPIGGEPRINDDESLEVRYFPPDALPELEIRHHTRIEIALRREPTSYFTRPIP